ncbi:class I SAM-dependent methyltransferase [Patescibacteria group bacterium]
MPEFFKKSPEHVQFSELRELRIPSLRGVLITQRDYKKYDDFLDIESEEAKGKRVLNIGSGRKGKFEDKMQQKGASVFTITPAFNAADTTGQSMRLRYYPKGWKKTALRQAGKVMKSMRGKEWADQPKPVAAFAEDLPFRDQSFDLITALYSVPLYTEKYEQEYRDLFSGIARVLKSEGTAKLFPIAEKEKGAIEQILREDKEISFDFKEIEEDKEDRASYREENQKTYRLTIRKN